MFEISKKATFEAAHFLPRVPLEHQCARTHGHSYTVEVGLVGDLDHHGWVTDFSVIGSALTPILTQLDHHQLNDVPGLDNPTCEVLARWIHERLRPHLPNLAWVKINETPTSSCLYRTPEATCPS